MRRHFAFLLLGLLACEHSGVGTTAPGSPDGALDSAVPTRLTYSGIGSRTLPIASTIPGNRDVAWEEDGRIVYAYGDVVRASPLRDTNGCVGRLPAEGGSRDLELCDREVVRIDSGTTAEWPAMREDGEISFVRRRFGPFSGFPYYSDFAIQSQAPGRIARPLFSFPRHSPTNGQLAQGIAFPRWVDRGHLIALSRMIKRGAGTLLETGLEVVRIDPEASEPFTPVPGTLYASSVDVDASGDTIYFTLGGDTRVYRRALSSGTVDTLFDFGTLGIARDARVGPDQLVAVVGGSVTFGPDSLLGMAQVDSGGLLMHVRLSTGTVTLLGFLLEHWQHPALAPDGRAVIAESGRDLWRIPLP